MTWSLAGLAAALILGVIAWRATGSGAFYSSEVYGMTARSHRRFSALCLGFALAFGLTAAWPLVSPFVVWSLFLLAALLYGSSFLRGYADHDS